MLLIATMIPCRHRCLLTWLAFLLTFPALPQGLTAVAATKVGVWSDRINREWWAAHPNPEDWITERKSIHEQLLVVHQKLGTERAVKNANFAGWMNHLKWLAIFPADWKSDATFGQDEGWKAYRQLGANTRLRDAFLNALSPYDDQERALAIYSGLQQTHPEEVGDYTALAVALALVFDQPFPAGWPHHFVDPSDVPRPQVTPAERFLFYVHSSQNRGSLVFDPRRLSAAELKFVIDTPITIPELSDLQQKVQVPLDKLFTAVKYDLTRLESGDYIWPHGSYTLTKISQRGGLCVDQAYFTVQTAKAKGIPSIIFLGQGNSGEHAWIGYLERAGLWRFDLAKLRNENYPVGQAYDPQTWRRLTDSECQFLSRRRQSGGAYRFARNFLTWAELNSGADFAIESTRLARKAAPEYLWAWEEESRRLSESNATVEVKARFWKDWINAFSKQKDLRFRGQKRLLALLEEAGEEARYNRLLADIIRINKSQRFDLVVGVAAERVFVHVENKRWEEADQTFRSAMTKLRTKGGGHLFYQLVQPYVQTCLEEGKTDYAVEAMRQSKRSFDAVEGSILDKDLKELHALVEAKAKR